MPTIEGTVEFTTLDGASYLNQMSVAKDGTADLTLYVVIENPEYPDDPEASEFLLGQSDFSATWDVEGGDAVFALQCDWDGCAYNTTMTCAFDDPGLLCDADPDFYADDAAILQWVEVE